MSCIRTTAQRWLRGCRVVAVCVCAFACMGAAPTSGAQAGEDSNGNGADPSDVSAAIETASDRLWKQLARADAKVKALGVGSPLGSDGASGGRSDADQSAPEISAQLRDGVSRQVRSAWAIHVAGSQVDIAVRQGRFKVENETTIPGGYLMTISYAVLWVLLLAFVGVLAVRERRLAAELDALEDELAGLDEA